MRTFIFFFLLLGFNTHVLAEPGKPLDKPVTTPPASHPTMLKLENSHSDSPGSVDDTDIVVDVPVAKPADDTGKQKKSVTFESLAQMDELITLGVPALALSLLEDEQQKRPQFSVDWYAFEYKRIVLLSALERWQSLINRTQWLFETAEREGHITRRIRLWFETQQVIAMLQLKQSDQALDQLQVLLWSSQTEQRDASLLPIWRRLVIRAYLQKSLNEDARRALIKYDREYNTDFSDIDWVLLQAQVLLKTHRPQQAVRLLQQLDAEHEIDVEALMLIATLQQDPKQATRIYQQMREKLDGKVLSRAARWAYSYVAYLASKVTGDRAARILNLESMLSLNIKYPIFEDNYHVDADDLWQEYDRRGRQIANENGLLFGNDAQWQKLSDKLIEKHPEQALSLNATLVLQTENFETRKQQHKTIVEIIEQRRNGLELINQLYLHSKKVSDVSILPDEVRYRLVDYSLSEGDYSEAAKIMKSLEEPPPGKTLFDWRMRKARVLVLQGEYQRSEQLIRKTFAEKPKISSAELDRYIQVVFDFQTVQQHQQALNLFNLLYIKGLNEKLKREIYFWEAESYFALEKYDRAALFYLESARAVSDGVHDLWGQSARFKAGKALVLAEIYSDAETVFKELLKVTASESRKALIRQNLQKIRLLKSTVVEN